MTREGVEWSEGKGCGKGKGREWGVDAANFPLSCPGGAYLRQLCIFEVPLGRRWRARGMPVGVGSGCRELSVELPRRGLPSTIVHF